MGVSSACDKNVLNFGSGDGCTTLITLTVYFELCILY